MMKISITTHSIMKTQHSDAQHNENHDYDNIAKQFVT
jgi:hypothetical protein